MSKRKMKPFWLEIFLLRFASAHARGCHDADAAAAAADANMAMKALRGMVNGAMSELSSAVSGTRPAAAAPASTTTSREHALAVQRDYISQPRLSESRSITPSRACV